MRRSTRTLRRDGAVAVAVTALIAVAGCSASDQEAPEEPAATRPPEVTAPTGSATTPVPAMTPVPPPAGTGDLQPVPSASRPTLEPRPLDRPADVGEGVTVRVSGVRGVTVSAQGPGQVSGPAVAVTVEVTNAAPSELTSAGVAVSLAYADTEASPVSADPASPIDGPIAAGSTVSGTYVFLVPEDQRDSVLVRVGLATSQPVVLFTGDVSG